MAYTLSITDTVTCPLNVTVENGASKASYNRGRNVTYAGSRAGERVPDWKEKLRLGSDATSAFTSNRFKLMSSTPLILQVNGVAKPPGTSRVVHTVRGYNKPFGHTKQHLDGNFSKANAIALTQIYRKMNSEITHVSVPTSLLEFVDVIRQFGSPMRSILKLTESHINRLYLQKRGIKAIKYNSTQWAKVASDSYLEYAFGLAPLINDTKDVAEALARYIDEAQVVRPKQRLVGRGLEEIAASVTSLDVVPDTWAAVRSNTKTVTQKKVQYVAGFSAYPTADPGSQDRLMQLLGFRAESWIPAIWEAVPWSWLVDYFTNVGDLLKSLEASTIKPTWISKTETSQTEFTIAEAFDVTTTAQLFNSFWCVYRSNSCVQGTSKSRLTTVARTKPPKLGFPDVYFRLPTEIRQMANMTAVVMGMRKSSANISLETHYRNMR